MSLKLEYNEVLRLHDEAARFLDNHSIPLEVREGKVPEYIKITTKLNALLSQMKEQGISYSDEEILEGFEEVRIDPYHDW
ncbi:hypothetical protein [Lutispora sp.]|uniref:hypothetical protein n=1 Tax=Lutispora sp. TaxID=2828727 RepID=UPI0035658BF6